MDGNGYEAICSLRETLTEIEQLLRGIQAYSYANYLEQLLVELQIDEPNAISTLMSDDFWGGAGSFFDLEFSEDYHLVSDNFTRDNRIYSRLLLQLLGILKSLGHSRRDFRKLEGYLKSDI